MTNASAPSTDALWSELWASLASLLRSYTAAHGLNTNREAIVELTDERIVVHHGKNRLILHRDRAQITWTRENGDTGFLQLTEHGRLLRSDGEEALDMAAEAWARELMQ